MGELFEVFGTLVYLFIVFVVLMTIIKVKRS